MTTAPLPPPRRSPALPRGVAPGSGESVAGPYADLVRAVRCRHRVRVRRWRRAMTGCAWRVDHPDGRRVNWVEAPVPRTPLSLAVFLHEVGHHAVGLDRYRRRCEEEYHACAWAMAAMAAAGVGPDAATRRRVDRSMRYAVDKAVRRGLRPVPAVLRPFLPAGAEDGSNATRDRPAAPSHGLALQLGAI